MPPVAAAGPSSSEASAAEALPGCLATPPSDTRRTVCPTEGRGLDPLFLILVLGGEELLHLDTMRCLDSVTEVASLLASGPASGIASQMFLLPAAELPAELL